MRLVSALSFWLGLVVVAIVATLGLSDNMIPEVLIGLALGPERVVVAFGSVLGLALVSASLLIRRDRQMVVPNWRVGALVVTAVVATALVVRALNPGFTTSIVQYTSTDVELDATLYRPRPAASVPAIVIVHGSAPFGRDFYDAYAKRLVKQGFAVLLADKRGAGRSGGVFVSDNNGSYENLSLLAQDVVEGVEFVAHQPGIDPERIGLLGISQAGWVAPLAAAKTPQIKYMVLVTGPTVSVGEEGRWSDLRGDDEADPIAGFDAAEAEMSATEASGFDPRPVLAELRVPVLWLFGDLDNSIPSRKSIAVLDSLPGGNHDYILYGGYGHMLVGKGGETIYNVAPESWSDIFGWLDENVPTARALNTIP